ncbi:MAG: creatininase family protein [Chloroflexi bacterium]|nr:creatininase family protein [Chloroflexota bacterium]
MELEKMNWKMVEDHVKKDDRIVLVAGATEEHGPNSLGTDTQTAWEIAKAACNNKGVMLGPALPVGPSAFSLGFPGTISLRVQTFMDMMKDILDSLVRSGFRRILIYSGHGGNKPAMDVITEYVLDRNDLTIKFREWYMMPKTYARIKELGSDEWDHGSWLESFSWINQPEPIPDKTKARAIPEDYYALSAAETREALGDGVGGGKYKQPESLMREFYDLAVAELEDFLDNGWGKTV